MSTAEFKRRYNHSNWELRSSMQSRSDELNEACWRLSIQEKIHFHLTTRNGWSKRKRPNFLFHHCFGFSLPSNNPPLHRPLKINAVAKLAQREIGVHYLSLDHVLSPTATTGNSATRLLSHVTGINVLSRFREACLFHSTISKDVESQNHAFIRLPTSHTYVVYKPCNVKMPPGDRSEGSRNRGLQVTYYYFVVTLWVWIPWSLQQPWNNF